MSEPWTWLCFCNHTEHSHKESFVGKFPCQMPDCDCDDFEPDFGNDIELSKMEDDE